jgi:predicted SAM-dependent methyltransferase
MKLNIGGQQSISRFPEGWTCVDKLKGADVLLDVTQRHLPFENESVNAIYCSHVLEHIWPWYHNFVLSEFYRVLKTSGVVRIVVPDMNIAIMRYLQANKSAKALVEYMRWWFDPTQDGQGQLYLNHVCGFNTDLLIELLKEAGFTDITEKAYNIYSGVFDGCDNPDHAGTSLFLEAHK